MQCIQTPSSDHLPVFFTFEDKAEFTHKIVFNYNSADLKVYMSIVKSNYEV